MPPRAAIGPNTSARSRHTHSRCSRNSNSPSTTRASAMPAHRIDESIAFVPVRIAVLTVSDTRDASNDISGDTLVARIKDAGHELAARTILRDDHNEIAKQLKAWIA